MYEQEGECQDPPQVMSREVQPGIVVNLDFGALASPAWEIMVMKEEHSQPVSDLVINSLV